MVYAVQRVLAIQASFLVQHGRGVATLKQLTRGARRRRLSRVTDGNIYLFSGQLFLESSSPVMDACCRHDVPLAAPAAATLDVT